MIVVIAVVGGGIAFALTRHSSKSTASPTPRSSVSSSSDFGGGAPLATDSNSLPTDSPTDESTDASSGAAVDGPNESDSKTVALRYIADVNSQNKADALTLICDEAKSSYQKSLQDSDNDFTYKWANAQYVGVSNNDDETTTVTFKVSVSKLSGGTARPVTVAFGVVDEDGAKLCSEDAN